MKTIFSDPKLCTPLCIFLVSWCVCGGGEGGGGDMYDSKCNPGRKVIPKKTQTGPLIMCCTRLVNSVTDHYKWISTVYIMTF